MPRSLRTARRDKHESGLRTVSCANARLTRIVEIKSQGLFGGWFSANMFRTPRDGDFSPPLPSSATLGPREVDYWEG